MLLRTAKRLLTLVIGLSSAFVAFTVIPIDQVIDIDTSGPHDTVIGLAVLVISLATRAAISERLLGSDTSPVDGTRLKQRGGQTLPPSKYQESARNAAAAWHPKDSFKAVVTALSESNLLSLRTIEELEIEPECIRSNVVRHIQLNDTTNLFPILSVVKGRLLNELLIEIDGKPVQPLGIVESHGITLRILETLFRRLFPRPSDEQIDCLESVLTAACSNTPADRRKLSADLTSLKQAVPAGDLVAFDTFRHIAGLAGESDFLFCPLTLPDAAPIGGYRITVAVSHRARRSDTLAGLNRIRQAIGLGLRTYVIDLPHVAESASYDLHLNMPKGMYIFRTALRPMRAATILPLARRTSGDSAHSADIRGLREAAGYDFLHLHLRQFNDLIDPRARRHRASPERRFWGAFARPEKTLVDPNVAEIYPLGVQLRIELREKPPGILLVVLLLSMYLTLITWAVGAFHSHVFPASCQPIPPCQVPNVAASASGSWTAVLFGIPALVAGFVLSRIDADALQRMSLVALAVLIWTVGNAGAAVMTAALKLSGVRPFTYQIADIHIQQNTWALIMASCAVNSIITICMIAAKTSRYWHRLSLDTQRKQVQNVRI